VTVEKNTYEISIKMPSDESAGMALIKYALSNMGLDLSKAVEIRQDNFYNLTFYVESKKSAENILNKFKKLNTRTAKISCNVLQESDWQNKWKENIKPFNITNTIKLCPVWCAKKSKKEINTILLDTENAFGIGNHPTTKFMAEFLEEKQGLYSDFFDVGTGTGILALVADIYGAEKIWAVDIDQESILTARKNFITNDIEVDYLSTVDFSKFRKKGCFDFVSANLLTEDLVRMRDKIVKYVNPGKYLAVSGISHKNYNSFRTRFDSTDIRCLRVRKSPEWFAVLYKKLER
jgi:ribosomal protein L11 methyltransferase